MLPLCTSGQKALQASLYSNGTLVADTSGDSPGEVCGKLSTANGGVQVGSISDNHCQLPAIASAAVFPIVKICDDSPQFTVEKMQDMTLVWGWFLLAAIVILCARKLLNVFDKAPHGEN